MNDEDLLAGLKGTPPAEVMNDSLFWARLQRDVVADVARRRRVVRLGAIATAAALVIGLVVARWHHGVVSPVPIEALDSADEPEASLGEAVEELSDDEVARAVKNFPRGG